MLLQCSRGSSSRRLVWLMTLVAVSLGCGRGVDPEVALTWRSVFDFSVLEGATDFRGDANGSDYGAFSFSYVPPRGEKEPLVALRERMLRLDSCLRLKAQSDFAISVECDHRRGVPPKCQMVEAMLGSDGQRLYVLCLYEIPRREGLLTRLEYGLRARAGRTPPSSAWRPTW